MKNIVVYKNENEYASFPILKKEGNTISIGFFVAPIPDHTGVFDWKEMVSIDGGETWANKEDSNRAPSVSSREIYDRFEYSSDGISFVTGSYGFRRNDKNEIINSKYLFHRKSFDNWETVYNSFYPVPNCQSIFTFPRAYKTHRTLLIPAYAILNDGTNRAFVWRCDLKNNNWGLYNMFPKEVNANEMAFVDGGDGSIIAHIRSESHQFLLQSTSHDNGITWTYPTCIDTQYSLVVGGPPHLLKLKSGSILCTYGYRKDKMGIRAILSHDKGNFWEGKINLRSDGGHLSSLRKKPFWKFWEKKVHPGNDVGYPVSIQLDNGEILTAYYITLEDGITGIEVTKWSV